MKKLAILALLALAAIISSCAHSPKTTITTTAGGEWEATLTGGTGSTSELNFVTGFNVTDTTGISNEPLDITSFGFFNAGSCFTNGLDQSTQTGEATLVTNANGQVSGSLSFKIVSSTSSSVLTLNSTPSGGVSGTSNGTTTTTGTLSNGIVWGTWQLNGGAGCQGQGNFTMCQGVATCTIP